ncbi:MAG: hypothetical protein GYB68_19150, partial [Chloroflexi bacterium]|nr:hypothetical protein [Chloroflexota bacterium]
AVLLPLIVAPVAGADRVARQMRFPRQDPRNLSGVEPPDVCWGLCWVTLWRLRWLIVVALALTPVLILSLLRLDLSDFATWRDSAQSLGSATAGGQVTWLLPDGSIPYGRLALRALSAGLLPWAVLPLLVVAGISSALVLQDASLSPLAALLGVLLGTPLLVLAWNGLTRMPLLRGPFELLRLLMLLGAGVAAVWLATRINDQNARWLQDPPRAPQRTQPDEPVSDQQEPGDERGND